MLAMGEIAAQAPSARRERPASASPRGAGVSRRGARGFFETTSSRSENGASPRRTFRPSSVTTRRSRSAAIVRDQLGRQQLAQHAAPVGGRALACRRRRSSDCRGRAGSPRRSPCRRECWRDGRRRTAPRCATPPTSPFARRAARRSGARAPLQTSQWPQGSASSPNKPSRTWRRQRAHSHSETRSSSFFSSTRLRASGASPSAIWRRRSAMSPAP